MYNIQQQEEMDYYPQSEQQNCFAEAQSDLAFHNSQTEARIDSLMAAGLYVVVCYYIWLCKATDASVGQARGIVSIHKTPQEAWKAQQEAEALGDPEAWYSVSPRWYISGK